METKKENPELVAYLQRVAHFTFKMDDFIVEMDFLAKEDTAIRKRLDTIFSNLDVSEKEKTKGKIKITDAQSTRLLNLITKLTDENSALGTNTKAFASLRDEFFNTEAYWEFSENGDETDIHNKIALYENKFVIKLEDDLNSLIKIKNELKETIHLLEKLCIELKG